MSSKQKKPSNNKRQRPRVQVFQCPSEFPTHKPTTATRRRTVDEPPSATTSSHSNNKKKRRKGSGTADGYLDFYDTAREVHSFGATGFEGKLKRAHLDDEYEKLTGRKRKHHSVPLPIVRGIRKKQAQREERQRQEAREAGLVIPTSQSNNKNKSKKRDRTADIHGPAPSIGFTKKGFLKIKDKPF